MKISTKLGLHFGSFFIFSLAVLAGIFFMTSYLEKSIQNNTLIEQLLDGFNDLNIVTYSYVLYPGERPQVQWELKHASLGNLLKRVNSENTAVLARMAENHRLARTLFDDSIRKFHGPRSQDQEVKERITSQLIARTQMMKADALVLKHASNAHLLATQREWFWIVTGILLIMLASVTWVSFFLKRRITGSLSALTQGTEIIRDGNLDYRTGIVSKDEIGRLSRSFDDMAENLKNTLVSRDALQREVEERKRAEEALRESEQRWATTLASIGDAVIAADVAGRITFMNAVAESLTGWALREASLKPVEEVFDIVNEQTRQKVENPVHKVLAKGNIVGLANHTVLVRKDGTEVPIDDSGAPIKDKDGKVTGVVLVFRDITERKEAEDDLRESEERYRALFENLNSAALLMEPILDGEGRLFDLQYVMANPLVKEHIGITREELVGKRYSELFHYGGRNPVFDIYEKVLFTGEPFRDEILIPALRRYFDVSIYRPAEGRLALVFSDVSERKRAEEAVRKAKDELEVRVRERTQELAKSRERLQYLASQLLMAQEKERKRVAVELHDGLLSELAAMKMLHESKIRLLEQGNLADLSELKKVSDILVRVIKETRGIMNNLHPSVLDELGLIAAMNWLVGEYQKSYPHIAVQKWIDVSEQDISDSVRVVIYRVLQEALNNFAKHGKGNRMELSLAKSDDAFALTIRDNGQGFDLEKAQKGLGLESMRERVEISGGDFQIKSGIGQGTTIRAFWRNP